MIFSLPLDCVESRLNKSFFSQYCNKKESADHCDSDSEEDVKSRFIVTPAIQRKNENTQENNDLVMVKKVQAELHNDQRQEKLFQIGYFDLLLPQRKFSWILSKLYCRIFLTKSVLEPKMAEKKLRIC